MNTLEDGFFVTGGTLQPDALSYVERQADTDVYESLRRGEYCALLTARQMGKSSLMVRTAARLRKEGVAVVALDLTALGQNLSPEQWYGSLLEHIGQQLRLEDELEEFWLDHPYLSPMQRWIRALREVVLPAVGRRPTGDGSTHRPEPIRTADFRLPSPVPKLVLFIDEIDAVRSLPFSTDEFFAAIRECYNRRTEDRELRRLTFCLLGVTTPADLIRDTRTTPFNIGRRIDLTDFTLAEAATLATGLVGPKYHGDMETRRDTEERGEGGNDRPVRSSGHPVIKSSALLQRVLYWTGGHPYLTQRLCRAVAEGLGDTGQVTGYTENGMLALLPFPVSSSQSSVHLVDQCCAALFLSSGARERDDNLLFVRDRLLRTDLDRTSLLELYRRVRSGKRVPADEADELVSLLRLSGIVRREEASSFRPSGHPVIRSSAVLRVRNRIYARVFDQNWATQQMPDAELRRQREAYCRGLRRASVLSALLLAVMGGLLFTAVREARYSKEQAWEARHSHYWAPSDPAAEALERHGKAVTR